MHVCRNLNQAKHGSLKQVTLKCSVKISGTQESEGIYMERSMVGLAQDLLSP